MLDRVTCRIHVMLKGMQSLFAATQYATMRTAFQATLDGLKHHQVHFQNMLVQRSCQVAHNQAIGRMARPAAGCDQTVARLPVNYWDWWALWCDTGSSHR